MGLSYAVYDCASGFESVLGYYACPYLYVCIVRKTDPQRKESRSLNKRNLLKTKFKLNSGLPVSTYFSWCVDYGPRIKIEMKFILT
jgi:hypothetical protein